MNAELYYLAPWLILAIVLLLTRPKELKGEISSFDIITLLVLSERKSGRQL